MSMKLWEKGQALDSRVARFTAGADTLLDRELLPWDLAGSAAHARMLGAIGALEEGEVRLLVETLAALYEEQQSGAFTVREADEDCHTAIEAALTERLGAVGKKIHLGRSRNDQVILALRLFLRARTLDLAGGALDFVAAMFEFVDALPVLTTPQIIGYANDQHDSADQCEEIGKSEGDIEILENVGWDEVSREMHHRGETAHDGTNHHFQAAVRIFPC